MSKKTLLTTCLSFYMPGWKTATSMQNDEGNLDWSKVSDLANYLQTEHYLTMHVLTYDEYTKLKKSERELTVKISGVAGGLWCMHATWHGDQAAQAQIPGGAVDHAVIEAWKQFEAALEEYTKRKVTAAALKKLSKENPKEYAAKMRRWGFTSNRKPDLKVLEKWVGTAPIEPQAVKPRKAGQRTARTLTLILNQTVTQKLRQRIKKGTNKGKYKLVLVTTKTPVKTIIVPLDPDTSDIEVGDAVESLVARLRPDPNIPSFNDYEYTIA